MADKLPDGHIQMGGKWAEMSMPGSETITRRRRSRAKVTPEEEPAEVAEESTEEEAEKNTSDQGV